MTVDEGATVAECCQLMVQSAGLQGIYTVTPEVSFIQRNIINYRMKRPS